MLSKSLNVTTSESILKIVRRSLKVQINESFRVYLEAVPPSFHDLGPFLDVKQGLSISKLICFTFLGTYNC